MTHDVSVVGLYILDVLGRVVDKMPEGGSVSFIDEIRLTVAGTAGGTVVDVSKLGLKALAVGAVGADEKADWMLTTMSQHGIDVSGMRRIEGVPSSASMLTIRRNGERPALHQRGASDHLDIGPSEFDEVLAPPIIHLGGTGLLAKLDGDSGLHLLREAKRRNRTVTFDLLAAHAGTMPLVKPMLPFIDYFMPSIEEAVAMSGMGSKEEAASLFLDNGVACCVFTLGEAGAYYAHRDGTRFTMPAFDVKVVDTTGCGDAFDAGMIAAIHHKMGPEDSVRLAQAAAALVATGLGSDAGIRSFDETLAFAREASVRGAR